MSKKPEILTTYLRNEAEGFSLALKGQETNVEINKCNFYTDRQQGSSPQYVIQTYSVGSLNDTFSKMIVSKGEEISVKRNSGVSVHYIIDKDGLIYQLVPDSKKPRVAGVGSFKTNSKLNSDIPNDMNNGMNDYCISIMSINNGKESLTAKQLAANLLLTKYLCDEYSIKSENVVALADWAGGRHIAPGPYFPWSEFAKHNLGLWSDVERKADPEVIVSWKKPNPTELEHIQQQFKELGMVVYRLVGLLIMLHYPIWLILTCITWERKL